MRDLYIGIVIGLMITSGLVIPVLFPPQVRFTKVASERIEKGMTLEEAEGIIGRPPGEYATTPIVPVSYSSNWRMCGERIVTWTDDAGELAIFIDPDGIACRVEFTGFGPDDFDAFRLPRWRLNRWIDTRIGGRR